MILMGISFGNIIDFILLNLYDFSFFNNFVVLSIYSPLSADEVLKKGFSTEAIKALTLDDISEEDLFQVDFVVG